MLSEATRLEALRETPESMREKLRRFRKLHPETYCEMFRPLLPVDALPSDALSDRQLAFVKLASIRIWLRANESTA